MSKHRSIRREVSRLVKAVAPGVPRRSAQLIVQPAKEHEVQRRIDAGDLLDALRPAIAALNERFAKWRKRLANRHKRGMQLTKQEQTAVRGALDSLDYVEQFDARYPHTDDGVPCRVLDGDASLLADRPKDMGLVVWQIVEPDWMDAETREHLAELSAAAERKRRAAEEPEPDPPAEPEPPTYSLDAKSGEPIKAGHRGPVSIRTDNHHSPARWRKEFSDAARQGRLRVKTMVLLLDPTRNKRR